MSFDVFEPGDVAWPRLLNGLPHDVYHLPGYARLCEAHEPSPVRLGVATREGNVLAMPFMLRDLPHDEPGHDVTVPYGYPGPVCSSSDPAIEESLLAELFGGFAAMGAVSVFIRCHPFLGVGLDALAKFGDTVVHGDQVYIDVTSKANPIQSAFRAGHRQNIDSLLKAGFSVRIDAREDIDAFPALYDRNMVRLDADPYYRFPLSYFEVLGASLASNTHFVTAASPDGELAASAIVFVCGTMGQYHLACTEDRFLKLAPSKLTILGMIELCDQLGVETLNLGGGVGGSADSLLDFKAGFSALRAPFATARVILDPERYRLLSEDVDAPPGFFPAYRLGL